VKNFAVSGPLGARIERLAVGEARPLDDDARRRVRGRGLDVKPAHVHMALDPIAGISPEPHRAAPRGGEACLDGAVQRGVHGGQHTMTDRGEAGVDVRREGSELTRRQ
jgi:hypothetical protein